jgi:enoyl-CoA hydratase
LRIIENLANSTTYSVTPQIKSNKAKFMTDYIKTEIDDQGVATITIDRPEKRNAMSFAMLARFLEVVDQLGEDPTVRVIIFTGGDQGSFCAGTDLSDLSSIPGSQRGLRGSAEQQEKWLPLIKCPKPVICAIDGPAVGMGAEFTSQCDVRIATPRARFAWNFVHRGLVPDTGAGTWILPRLLGHQKALQLLYSGEFISADQALEMGYVIQVVDSDALLSTARAEAERYLQGSPFSIARIKSLVYAGLERSIADHMVAHTAAMKECFESQDHAEGVAAFLESRPPKFEGV